MGSIKGTNANGIIKGDILEACAHTLSEILARRYSLYQILIVYKKTYWKTLPSKNLYITFYFSCLDHSSFMSLLTDFWQVGYPLLNWPLGS